MLWYLLARARFHAASGRSYLKKRNHWKSVVENVFEHALQESEDDKHWMNDVEFKRKYRCPRPMIDEIVDKLETNVHIY